MPKLTTLPILIHENLKSTHFEREPEPDLIMDNEDQVQDFQNAGRIPGAMNAIYIYHTALCSATIQGCKTVVDLGCGPGIPLIKLARLNPEIQFIGLDLSEQMLERAENFASQRQIKNVQFKKSDFTNLSMFKDQSVDGVVSMQAFHHLPTFEHLENTFKEVKRVLKPEGSIYFQDLIRLKSRYSTIHFAYYDPEAPYLTQLDGERSMRAAFLFEEYKRLGATYLPRTTAYKTAMLDLYMVLKTPSKPLPADVQERIQGMKNSMTKSTLRVYRDLSLFHRMGGLK